MPPACSTARISCGTHHSPRSGLDEYCTRFCEHRACSTAHGSCGPHHSPRSGLAGYCTPFCETCVCSTAPTVSGYCSPIHLPHPDPRASVDAPAPSGLRGFQRAPRSGPYENRSHTSDLVRPRFERPLATAPPLMSAFYTTIPCP